MSQFKNISIVKTVAAGSDILLLQNPTSNETYQITKANLVQDLATQDIVNALVPNIATSGLIFHVDASNTSSYPGTGTTWTTLVGTSNVTLANCTYSSTDGGAIVFNGTSSVGTFTRPSIITVGSAISIEMWVKWLTIGNAIANIQCLIDNNSSSSGIIIQDFPQASSVLSTPAGATTFPIGIDEWTHIVSTIKGTIAKLYINGQLMSTALASGSLSTVGTNFTLGKWQGGTRYLNGQIGAVRLYSRALTATEAINNFQASKARFGL